MEKIKALIALGLITEADVFDYYHELERVEIEKKLGLTNIDWSEMSYDSNDDYESL